MGEDEADGMLVSGQLELYHFLNKCVPKWHPDFMLLLCK